MRTLTTLLLALFWSASTLAVLPGEQVIRQLCYGVRSNQITGKQVSGLEAVDILQRNGTGFLPKKLLASLEKYGPLLKPSVATGILLEKADLVGLSNHCQPLAAEFEAHRKANRSLRRAGTCLGLALGLLITAAINLHFNLVPPLPNSVLIPVTAAGGVFIGKEVFRPLAMLGGYGLRERSGRRVLDWNRPEPGDFQTQFLDPLEDAVQLEPPLENRAFYFGSTRYERDTLGLLAFYFTQNEEPYVLLLSTTLSALVDEIR